MHTARLTLLVSLLMCSVVADARARGLPTVVGVTPTVEADGTVRDLPPEAATVLGEAEAAGAVVVDVEAAVRDAGGTSGLFLDSVHFTTEGHRVVGDARRFPHIELRHTPVKRGEQVFVLGHPDGDPLRASFGTILADGLTIAGRPSLE